MNFHGEGANNLTHNQRSDEFFQRRTIQNQASGYDFDETIFFSLFNV